mmetsp:Transcript_77510/g.250906  ORF Transcript_77510/g.250906 Transcript_77510/m.250906 type:complete len:492 (+) Transcript_77510:196-1671(+)
MLARALEGAAAMHHQVVVQEHHVTLLHLNGHRTPHGDLVQLLQPVVLHLLGGVGVVDVRLVDPRGASGLRQTLISVDLLALAAQELRVRVHGAPPSGLTRVGVPDDGHLRHRADLQDLAAVVLGPLPDELRVEVHLHLEGLLHRPEREGLDRALQEAGESFDEAHRELRRRVSDLPLVGGLEPILAQLLEHLAAVGDEELTTFLRGLEAYEDGSARGSVPDHLVVHADVELAAGGLVHGLVDTHFLVDGVSGCHGVKGILASLELQRLANLREARALFGDLEAAKHNRSMNLQILIDLRQVILEVRTLRIEIACHLGGHLHLKRGADVPHGLALRRHINVLLAINCVGAIGQSSSSHSHKRGLGLRRAALPARRCPNGRCGRKAGDGADGRHRGGRGGARRRGDGGRGGRASAGGGASERRRPHNKALHEEQLCGCCGCSRRDRQGATCRSTTQARRRSCHHRCEKIKNTTKPALDGPLQQTWAKLEPKMA